MARLPQVGGDAGDWGDILNEYLSQSHDENGNIKSASISTSQLVDGSVTTLKIAAGAVTTAKLDKFGQANGVASLDVSGHLPEAQLPTRLSASELSTTIADSLVAGTNISLSQNEEEGTVTINAIVPEPDGGHIVRSDTNSTYSYMGTAPSGTAEGSSGWAVTRITLNVSPIVVETGTGTWTGRAGIIYG